MFLLDMTEIVTNAEVVPTLPGLSQKAERHGEVIYLRASARIEILSVCIARYGNRFP